MGSDYGWSHTALPSNPATVPVCVVSGIDHTVKREKYAR